MPRINRRRFMQNSAALGAGLAAATESPLSAAPMAEPREFASRWAFCNDRVWLGPEYWANPLQDWRLAGGRAECVNAAPDRNVHLLVRDLGPQDGDLQMSVRVGRVAGGPLGKGAGSIGFRVGIQGPLREYRNNLIFGTGLNAGLTADGGLFVGDIASARPGTVKMDAESVELRLTATPAGGVYTVTLTIHGPDGGELGRVSRPDVPAERLVGNLAIVANFGRGQPGGGQGKAKGKGKAKAKADAAAQPGGTFWFADWRVAASKVEPHGGRSFGPILFSQYTLSRGVLKMTAQMPPVGPKDPQVVRLQLGDGRPGNFRTVAEAPIEPEARTATFRVEKWNDKVDVVYRLAYEQRFSDGRHEEHFWQGTIRRDPVDKPVLTVADVSCNTHAAFPNERYVANMAKLNPDLLAFVGDQFYESTGGYGVTRAPLDAAILDYLRKWFMHGWTWRELTKDRPSLSLPDDHDVYQGNLWGEAGAPRRGTQEMGGYDMVPTWVNVVHRTQTSHHPDPPDPAPARQDVSVYFGPLVYGRVSFAVLADRQFKSGPEGKVPPTGGRGDHVTDATWDPKTADVPGLQLLGERQMKFLRDWTADWRGADMKAVVSQTIFTAMATTHGGQRERLRADYDANGWPQTPRNEALREIRKAFAVHIAGDQHLPAVIHYGIDAHGDGPVAFAGPAVNVGYPRWFEPREAGKNRKPGAPETTGEFIDHFGHPMTVLALVNGAVTPRRGVLESLQDKTSGLALVRFDKANRKVTFECWPFLADPTAPDTQFPGWPVTIGVLDNYGRKPAGHLPTLEISGVENPVVQVVAESDGEVVYTLRIAGRQFRPPVFATGRYTVRVSEPDTGRAKEVKGIEASAGNTATLDVRM